MTAFNRRFLKPAEVQWSEGEELNPDNKPTIQKTEFTNPEQSVDKSVDDVEKKEQDD